MLATTFIATYYLFFFFFEVPVGVNEETSGKEEMKVGGEEGRGANCPFAAGTSGAFKENTNDGFCRRQPSGACTYSKRDRREKERQRRPLIEAKEGQKR
jgi:hypothetical protein